MNFTETERKTLKRAIEHYGLHAQLQKLVEEAAELLEAWGRLNSLLMNKPVTTLALDDLYIEARYRGNAVIEEAVDFLIVAEQVRIFHAAELEGYDGYTVEQMTLDLMIRFGSMIRFIQKNKSISIVPAELGSMIENAIVIANEVISQVMTDNGRYGPLKSARSFAEEKLARLAARMDVENGSE